MRGVPCCICSPHKEHFAETGMPFSSYLVCRFGTRGIMAIVVPPFNISAFSLLSHNIGCFWSVCETCSTFAICSPKPREWTAGIDRTDAGGRKDLHDLRPVSSTMFFRRQAQRRRLSAGKSLVGNLCGHSVGSRTTLLGSLSSLMPANFADLGLSEVEWLQRALLRPLTRLMTRTISATTSSK
jgi:hypothetical protein